MICLLPVDNITKQAATSGGTHEVLVEHLQVQLKMAKKLETRQHL
jgi:hypothetical protein